MKHYGDITKLHGDALPHVDIITGGSPCQDLSVAGKRAGLDGERSGLFMEQIRIIKEMRDDSRRLCVREPDGNIKPRFMVWENVPGAFSSNKGEDFRCVLEETAKIADENAVIPGPEKGKWAHSGCVMGDGWSIAWRVHDAQFWGVPQRRKRIALVADFGGECAPEILFEREGMPGDSPEGYNQGEGTADNPGNSPEEAGCVSLDVFRCITDEDCALTLLSRDYKDPQVICFEPGAASRVGGHIYEDDIAGTIRAHAGDNQTAVVYGICAYTSNAMLSDNPYSGIYEAETARTLDLNGGSPACNQGGMAVVCLEGNGSRPSHKGDGYAESEVMYTLNATEHHAVCLDNHPADSRIKICEDGIVPTLSTRMGTGGNNVPLLMESVEEGVQVPDVAHALRARANCDFREDSETYVVNNYIVRRLTPLECERLQGFQDGWTDIGDWVDSKGKKHKGDADAPRYRALGNSIALPFWQWMAGRIMKYYPEGATMGSLFDGIGGFPLAFSRVGCIPIWASEIEDFCIAVTKRHFGEEES